MGASVESSPEPPERSGPGDEGIDTDAFKEALARWAAGVCIVAVRDDDGGVYGTTVGSFASVSADPPRILFSLGAGAQILPFIEEGTRFVVNILSEDQQRLASAYADPFPVGPPPFPEEGDPVIAGAHAQLICDAVEVVSVESSRVVIGSVEAARIDAAKSPLLYYMRDYRRLVAED